MKNLKWGVVIAIVLLFTSILQSFAIEGLQLSVKCSNVVLSWPTVDGSGATYMIRRRADLTTNSSWQVIADFYSAATGTNITTYTDVGVVTNANCDGSLAPLGGSGSMMAMSRGTFSPILRSTNIPVPPPMPPLPPGLGYSTNSDGSVSVVSVPINNSSSGFVTADDVLVPSPPGGGGGGGGGGDTNIVPPTYAFYEVVKDGATLYGLTNGTTVSGTLKLPVEVANYAGQLSTLTLQDNGSPIASTIQTAPFITPVPILTLDTTQLTNGVHNISVYAQWTDPGDGTEDGSQAVYEANSGTNSITVSNEISFPNWMSEFGELTNSMVISAVSAHTNAEYFVDVYDSTFTYIGTFNGTTPDGNIYIVWDLKGPDNVLHNDPTFEFVVTTVYGDPVTNSAATPATYRQTDPYAGPGDWVVANQQAWENFNGSDLLDIEADTIVKIPNFLNLAVRPTAPAGASYRIRYGNDPNVKDDWQSFRTALYNSLSRNLFYLGHGTPNGLGFDQTSTNTSILATEIATVLANTPGSTNAHKYRFVCFDGCSTAKGKLPESFGISNKEDVDPNIYVNSATRPSAFAGWDDDVAAGFAGSVNVGHVNFMQHFANNWLDNAVGVKQAFVNAGASDDLGLFGFSVGHMKVFGDWSLTVNAFNR